jgi:hypothetical protein
MSATALSTQRPTCEQPFLAGDPAFHETWGRIAGERGCDRPATWRVVAYVRRLMGDRYRDRIPARDVVIVYGCGSHPLAPPARMPWGACPDITAEPLDGYELPAALRPLAVTKPKQSKRRAA